MRSSNWSLSLHIVTAMRARVPPLICESPIRSQHTASLPFP